MLHRARRVSVRLLHARSDYVGGGVRSRRACNQPAIDPRVDERQHLPMRCIRANRRRCRSRREEVMMQPFSFSRATSLDAALGSAADGATFVAGGTELLNWMKEGIASPLR